MAENFTLADLGICEHCLNMGCAKCQPQDNPPPVRPLPAGPCSVCNGTGRSLDNSTPCPVCKRAAYETLIAELQAVPVESSTRPTQQTPSTWPAATVNPSIPTVKTYRTAKGVVVESALTNQEVVETLTRHPSRFAGQLLQKRKRYGHWTNDQEAWAHKLAQEQIEKEMGVAPERPYSQRPATPGFTKTVTVFNHALNFMRSAPQVMFTDPNAFRVLLKLAIKGKHRGTIWVSNGYKGSYDNILFGWITQDGIFHEASDAGCVPRVHEILCGFNQNPQGFAEQAGKRQRVCPFCNTTADESGLTPYCRRVFFGQE